MLTVLKKHQPIYTLSNGKLYVKVAERDAKKIAVSERVVEDVKDEQGRVIDAKVLWFLPLANPPQPTLPMLDQPGTGEA